MEGKGPTYCPPYNLLKKTNTHYMHSKESILPAYVAWRAGAITLFVAPAPQESIPVLLKRFSN
jgi:hypothetical protein